METTRSGESVPARDGSSPPAAPSERSFIQSKRHFPNRRLTAALATIVASLVCRIVAQDAPSQAPLASCPLPPVEMVPATMLDIEAGKRQALQQWLRLVVPTLRERFDGLQEEFRTTHKGAELPQTSGYRATEYQNHFYSLRKVWIELHKRPELLAACATLWDTVNHDIDRHGIRRCTAEIAAARRKQNLDGCPVGLPFVNPPQHSLHTRNPAEAIDVSKKASAKLIPQAELDELARKHGLTRLHADDDVHFTLGPDRIDSALLIVRFASPVTLTGPSGLVVPMNRDPDEAEGLGFAAPQLPVSDLQVFDLPRTTGTYRLSGETPTGATVSANFVRFTEHGRLLDARNFTQRLAAGETFSADFPIPDLGSTALPPIVMPPRATRVRATSSHGTTAAASPALDAWLQSARALDDGQDAPEALSPLIAGQDVTAATNFPVGETTVRFRYRDAGGNVGEASSRVVVFRDRSQTRARDGASSPSPVPGPLPAPARTDQPGAVPVSRAPIDSRRSSLASDWRVVIGFVVVTLIASVVVVRLIKRRQG
jgi:hypothetical protein